MAKWLALAVLAGLLGAVARASPPQADIVVSNSEGGSLLDFIGKVMADAYSQVGAKAVVKTFPTARSIEMANNGVTDAEALRGPGLEHDFPNLIPIPEPIVMLEYRAYTVGKPLEGEGWTALRGKRICVNLGEKLIEDRTRGFSREMAHGIDAALKMLKAGRCEVVVANQFVWLTVERDNLGTFCAGSGRLDAFPLFHYVNKRHADLVPGLTAALRDIRDSGRLDRYLAADPNYSRLDQIKSRYDCAATDAARP